MREIVLDPEFERKVQWINPHWLNEKRNMWNVMHALARALDELPVDMAEDVIYHSLVTASLGGRQVKQHELVLSLLELCRIRAEKGDGFNAIPTARWSRLHDTPEYQAVAKIINCPLEMGLVLHTISTYLRENSSYEVIHKSVVRMRFFKNDVEWMSKNDANRETINKKFHNQLVRICSTYAKRGEYLECFPYECENLGEFEIAFANLFIMMANTRSYML